MDADCEGLNVFERRACKALSRHRPTGRRVAALLSDEDALTTAIVALAVRFGRYGYRHSTTLLQMAGR